MKTECPHCNTSFRFTSTQLEAADGMVRCGLCHEVFKAAAHTPDSGINFADIKQPEVEQATSKPKNSDELFNGRENLVIPDEFRAPHIEKLYSTWATVAWSLGILLLTLALVLEYAWFNRNQLVSVAQLKPLMTKICELTDCESIALRDPEKIEMLTRNVFSHPNVKKALMVSVTMVNHASYAQPYPDVQIDFSDVRGDLVAARRFKPEEYLQLEAEEIRPLEPETPTTIALEIKDPGKQAMTYQFGFY